MIHRVIITLCLLAHPASAQDIPVTRVRNCTTAGCHAPIMDHKVMHAPTSISECGVCHEYEDPAAHSFVLKRRGAAMCTFCHLGTDTQLGMVGHEPFDKGECTSCHDPHGSEVKTLLITDTQAGLCAKCHESVIKGSHIHSPAADGECLGCHGAHGADYDHLLNRTGPALCLTCHEDVRDFLGDAAVRHKPVTEDCLDCHAAHASDFPDHLLKGTVALCESCHADPVEAARKASVKHSAVFEGRACLNCHQPHASNDEELLNPDPVGSCLECHAEPVRRHDGSTVAGVPEIAAKGAVLHGPVRKGLCTGCHELHGSDHAELLTANYTPKFYAPFDLNNYALCFECHAEQLVLKEVSATETNFRNGTLNLHYVHVNRKKKGRACRACHATHASRSEVHVVDSVPFGKWQLPLNFRRTETGGSCDSGCHRPATYDRFHATIGIEPPTTPGEQKEETTPPDQDAARPG